MNQKIYIFAGVQASGKGTQGEIVSQKLNLAHISTGELLREASGALREEIDSYDVAKGNFVPDDLILKVLEKRMRSKDCNNGIILDGYPRNIAQAKTLDSKLDVSKVFEIQISEEEAFYRLSGRYLCQDCKKIYNINTGPLPKIYGFCDYCDGKLTQRQDDSTKEAIQKRINDYNEKTKKIIEHYKDKVSIINGEQTIKKVTKDILNKLI